LKKYVWGQRGHSGVVEATAEVGGQVREQSGEMAALDSLAEHSNWTHSPPADLENDDRKPHM